MSRLAAFVMLFSCFMVNTPFSSQETDVLYLKNGTVFHGKIIEQNVGVDIRIKTDDGKVIIFPQNIVAKIAIENIADPSINYHVSQFDTANTFADTFSVNKSNTDTSVMKTDSSFLSEVEKNDIQTNSVNDTIYFIDSTVLLNNNQTANDTVSVSNVIGVEIPVVKPPLLNEKELVINGDFKKVVLKSGDVIIGKITHINKGKYFTLRKNTMREETVNDSDVISINSARIAKHGSIGVGYGIPYGIAGASLDVALFDFVHLTGALGYTVLFPDLAWNTGIKVYFIPSGYPFRPRIMACYGTNALLMVSDLTSDRTESCGGLTLGLGQLLTFGEKKRNGFDLDVMCIVTSNIFNRVKVLEEEGMIIPKYALGRIKFDIGYRFCF